MEKLFGFGYTKGEPDRRWTNASAKDRANAHGLEKHTQSQAPDHKGLPAVREDLFRAGVRKEQL